MKPDNIDSKIWQWQYKKEKFRPISLITYFQKILKQIIS